CDHHGRQRSLGHEAGPAPHRWPQGRSGDVPPHRYLLQEHRRKVPDGVRLFHGKLEAVRDGGLCHHGPAEAVSAGGSGHHGEGPHPAPLLRGHDPHRPGSAGPGPGDGRDHGAPVQGR
ncbi:50S ribosomal protein L20, partial [Dysosmobacter welbionis]